MKTLLTGFTPFENRSVNASWIAARQLHAALHTDQVDVLELPVLWGKPAEILYRHCESDCPHRIIAMGEGRPGWFDIETLARRAPAPRADNAGDLPTAIPWPEGPPCLEASIDARKLHHRLYYQRMPIRLSRDAGGFLCEQTLYTLEILKRQFEDLQSVVFVHLPPYSSPVLFEGEETLCDEPILLKFASRLFDATAQIDTNVTTVAG